MMSVGCGSGDVSLERLILSSFRRDGPNVASYQLAGRKSLDQICHVEQLEKLSPEEVKRVWVGRHRFHLQKYGTVMSWPAYRALRPRLLECPFFVVPVLRSKLGFFNVVVNHQPDLTLGLPLAEWQRLGGSATPSMTIQFFTELGPRHGLVLVRTEVAEHVVPTDPHHRILREDAVWVTDVVLRYYTFPHYYEAWVEPFNKAPHTFDFAAYVRRVMADAEGKIDFPKVVVEGQPRRYDPSKM